jgi:hypothetical protein
MFEFKGFKSVLFPAWTGGHQAETAVALDTMTAWQGHCQPLLQTISFLRREPIFFPDYIAM